MSDCLPLEIVDAMNWFGSAHLTEATKFGEVDRCRLVLEQAILRYGDQRAEDMRERAALLCNIRSCSWSEADDRGSEVYREGIENAATQLRDAIRALPVRPA